MSRLMRMAYGHGGTRLERLLVSSPHQEPAPLPLRLKLLLAIWIIVPVLVSLYAIPTTSLPMNTLIDISRLPVKPPPELVIPVIPEPKPVSPVEQLEAPPPKPVTDLEQPVEQPLVRQTIVPQVEELKRPSIARSAPNLPDLADSRPLASRERKMVDAEVETTQSPRLRRDSVPASTPLERAAVSRSRGALQDVPAARERIAVLRRQPTGETPVTGSGTRPGMTRSGRSSGSPEEGASRVVTTRERAGVAGGGSGQPAPAAGVTRGVSLMSLEICSSTRQQEEAIKSILAVVGSRQSCRNERGEFQFKGTQRISSFNLVIFPSQGRKLSNRCEELEDAYNCLTHK